MSGKVRRLEWDGSPAVTCDWIACTSPPVLFADIAALNPAGERLDYGSEAYLCEEHLDQLLGQARATLVVNGAVKPTTALERNLLATVEEHLP